MNTTPEQSQIPDHVPAPAQPLVFCSVGSVLELPTGTVTFLFTDIEGSTRLLQELGHKTYRRVQDDHGKILRGAIAAGDGVEVRTEGDSFFAVFSTPDRALQAAVAGQRGLAAQDWPGDVALRVRMGLHTGVGVLESGGADYVGVDVNRAARIAAAGHGGQILLSHATRALIEPTLPNGVMLRDLGQHRLKDIDYPEHLHDLIIDGHSSDFATVKSLDIRPAYLPSQRTSFVGREKEITETNELLGRSRLLTLTGPGGTGKTRLALRVAGGNLDRFPDGVFMVDLSATVDPMLVVPEIAAALRVREMPGRDLAATLSDHLRDKALLLVIDNFEQLLGAIPVVSGVLDAAPGVTILATSRVPLRISGEQEYHVSPLPLPVSNHFDDPDRLTDFDSVVLFMERATAVRPDFRITKENAASIAEISARVDGLPLALELAASRIKIMSPTELATRLDKGLSLLTSDARDVPVRQRTLRGTIQWSHDLLDAEQRRLFARLAVFAGGWTLEAAEAICGPRLKLEMVDGLTSLVDSSLVTRSVTSDGSIRFGMLETIREYAHESFTGSADEVGTRHRHTEFFRVKAEESAPHLPREGHLRWLKFLEREHDNLRAALEWAEKTGDTATALRTAAALWRFWQLGGHLEEGRARLERLLELPGAKRRDSIRTRALGALGGIAYWQTDYETTRSAYEEAVEIARELGEPRLLSEAIYDLSHLPTVLEGDFDGSEWLLHESLRLADPADLPLTGRIWTALGFMGMVQSQRSIADRIEPIQKAITIGRELGDRLMVASNLIALAGLEFATANFDAARDHVQDAVKMSAGAESPILFATSFLPLAIMANHDGRHRRAAHLLGALQMMNEHAGGSAPEVAITFFGDPEPDARAALGDEEFERAWAEGYSSTVDEAVAFALDVG
jgi:predicted ATPase/class 3 adenylate cyclase